MARNQKSMRACLATIMRSESAGGTLGYAGKLLHNEIHSHLDGRSSHLHETGIIPTRPRGRVDLVHLGRIPGPLWVVHGPAEDFFSFRKDERASAQARTSPRPSCSAACASSEGQAQRGRVRGRARPSRTRVSSALRMDMDTGLGERQGSGGKRWRAGLGRRKRAGTARAGSHSHACVCRTRLRFCRLPLVVRHTPLERLQLAGTRILMRGCTRTEILHAVRFLSQSPPAEALTSISKRLFVV